MSECFGQRMSRRKKEKKDRQDVMLYQSEKSFVEFILSLVVWSAVKSVYD